jgi:uroporphyrin-III C-methyltransferase
MTDTALQSLLRQMPELPAGHVWLAGAGPGDPGLLTLHTLSALAQADAVVHDALVDGRILALARPGAELVFAGKRGGRPSVGQADITATLIAFARAGRRVLRLKGGDPYVFGRGAEEALTLAEHGIPFRVIPGITAGIGGLAAALIPATLRGVNQAFVLATGHGAEDGEVAGGIDWVALARLGQPIIFYMALTHIAAIVRLLLEAGMAADTPAAVVACATTPAQRVLVSTLATLPEDFAAAELGTPAILVVGHIVAMRARLLALLPELAEAAPWRAE